MQSSYLNRTAAGVFLAAALAAAPIFALPAASAPTPEVTHIRAADVAAFAQAQIPLAKALALAEARSGGKGLDIALTRGAGRMAYSVKTLLAGAVWEGSVDAATGKITGKGKVTALAKLDAEDQAEISGLSASKFTLADIVARVGANGADRIIDAGLEASGGKPVYDFKVLRAGVVHELTIDPATGEVTSDREQAAN